MNSYRESSRLSGSAQTFKILMQSRGLETLSEFRHTPKISKPRQLPTKANILAHILLNLWTAAPPEEDENFIAKIKYITNKGSGYRLHLLSSSRLQFKDVPPETIHAYFLENKAHNLGSLTLFNLLCSGHLVPDDIILTRSPKTNLYYFSQGFHEFWSDFFNDYTEHVHIASHHSMQDKYSFFIPGDEPWWDIALPDYQILKLKQLFRDEFFQLYLRIACSPWFFIKKIGEHLFGGEDAEDVASFFLYLQERIDWFVIYFQNFLNEQEAQFFKQWKSTQGAVFIEKYLLDIQDYFQESPLLSQEAWTQTRVAVIGLAMKEGISNLEIYCHGIRTSLYSPVMKNICFNYVLKGMEAHQQEVLLNPEHFYWHMLEHLAGDILPLIHEGHFMERSLFNIHLFNKAIQFHKNNIVLYFLSKNESFKYFGIRECLEADSEKDKLEQKTPLFVSLYYQNLVAVRALKSKSAEMSGIEKESLQSYLMLWGSERQESAFSMILEHCPSVLESDFFLQALKQNCAKNAPELLKYFKTPTASEQVLIRPKFTRRQSFSLNLQELGESSEAREVFAKNKKP